MQTPLRCDRCGDQIGWHITYPLGSYYGDDPPEDAFYDDAEVWKDDNVCASCYQKHLEEEEGESPE